jgi:hypothetical protein
MLDRVTIKRLFEVGLSVPGRCQIDVEWGSTLTGMHGMQRSSETR